MSKEKRMKRFLATLSVGLMLVAPVVATAASSTRGNLPAAVDQMLAQDMIQLAESQLKVAGFDPGPVDGIFDEQTAAAVRKYQAANSLPVSGLLDEPTRTVLMPGHDNAGGES
jgi:peptidoglycan hydrolase-like protein with peptidoglycan-binding domain